MAIHSVVDPQLGAHSDFNICFSFTVSVAPPPTSSLYKLGAKSYAYLCVLSSKERLKQSNGVIIS